jgi:hypothetical protein
MPADCLEAPSQERALGEAGAESDPAGARAEDARSREVGPGEEIEELVGPFARRLEADRRSLEPGRAEEPIGVGQDRRELGHLEREGWPVERAQSRALGDCPEQNGDVRVALHDLRMGGNQVEVEIRQDLAPRAR